MALMTISISALCAFYTIQRHREMTKKLWKTRATVLAEAVHRMVLWDDRVAVKQLLMSEVRGSDVLLYCFILKSGKPYVFTFEKGVPKQLVEHKPEQPGQNLWEYQDLEGMVVYDISTDIDNADTTLRIGLKVAAIDAKMQPLILSIVLICLAALGISSYLALAVAARSTREIDALVEALKNYGELNDESFSLTSTSSEVTELVSSFKKLTAMRKNAEEDLSRLNSRLEQLVHERTVQLLSTNQELDAFAYSVSHDLRAPLRGIEGFSYALLEDYGDKLDDTGKGYLDRIRQGCIRMGRLIDDMLKLSRITRSELQLVPTDLGEMAEQIISELQRSDQERSVDFSLETAMPAVADPVLIRSVMENFLGNAWKFTRNTEKAVIRCGAIDKGTNPVYYVKDNGAGFNMEYKNKLFSAFQRLHRIDEFEGTGVGLASVQRIVTRHGGKVWAEGEEGKGATFYFTLGEHC
jgi:signal transduction histidine kinase